jgi:hypothetical protein
MTSTRPDCKAPGRAGWKPERSPVVLAPAASLRRLGCIVCGCVGVDLSCDVDEVGFLPAIIAGLGEDGLGQFDRTAAASAACRNGSAASADAVEKAQPVSERV